MSLIKAREKAIVWHNLQKKIRIEEVKVKANTVLTRINSDDLSIIELAVAMLYLGEGSKKGHTSMGNTNPLILKFFIKSLNILYGIDKNKLKCQLHLRLDQDGQKMKSFWSHELGIPIGNFTYVKDKRSIKSKTFSSYMGVCVIECGRIDLLRRLNFISEGFCDRIVESANI